MVVQTSLHQAGSCRRGSRESFAEPLGAKRGARRAHPARGVEGDWSLAAGLWRSWESRQARRARVRRVSRIASAGRSRALGETRGGSFGEGSAVGPRVQGAGGERFRGDERPREDRPRVGGNLGACERTRRRSKASQWARPHPSGDQGRRGPRRPGRVEEAGLPVLQGAWWRRLGKDAIAVRGTAASGRGVRLSNGRRRNRQRRAQAISQGGCGREPQGSWQRRSRPHCWAGPRRLRFL